MPEITVDLKWTPRPHQLHAMQRMKRFNVLVWHRRAGKTVFAVLWLLLHALRTPEARNAYIAPLLKQAKDVAWSYLVKYARMVPGTRVNESETSVTLFNGARVRLYGADNPDSLRGILFDRVVMDEVAQMRPIVWGEIVRPQLVDRRGHALFIGTPKGVNTFSELFYSALQDDDWYAERLTVDDTTCIPEDEIAAARKVMSPPQFAQEFMCDFGAACDDALIQLDVARAAAERDYPINAFAFAHRVLGVDVARFGGDRTVLFPRQGIVSINPTILVGADTKAVVDAVAVAIEKWKPVRVWIDAGYTGAAIVDTLLHDGHRIVEGVDFGSAAERSVYRNKRAEMWGEMAAWLRSGGAIPKREDLIADLTAPRYSYDTASARLTLESKQAMRDRGLKSPDLGDALALTFARVLPARREEDAFLEALGITKEAAHADDFDPFRVYS